MFRKILTSTLLSLVIVGGFFIEIGPSTDGAVSFVSETYAADCGGTGQPCTSDQEMVNMYNKMVGGLNIALELLSFIVSPAIMLAGWLMSPDWTSGDLFKLRPILHDLWVLISNITYFIYAILLIFIALATIFNSQNYGYKKLLPRLALGIILVPLTWWFVQFIISLSTIVTASVMNLPTDVMNKYIDSTARADTWWTTPSIPDIYEFYTDPGYAAVTGQKQYSPDSFKSPKQILTDASGIYGSLLIYGNGLFKFNEIKKLSTTKDVAQSIGGIVNKGILGVIMFVIFGFLVIALIFMLMMRAIKLWFYAIFSPLLTLRYVIGDGLFGKDNGDSFDIKEFIGLAFVPAIVGLALSFGIVIIALLQSPNIGSDTTPCPEANMAPGGPGCQILGIMGSSSNYIRNRVVQRDDGSESATSTINVSLTEVVFGGITFKFYGAIVTDIKDYAATSSGYSSALSATGSVFGTIILDIIALIFLWAAFMAAKNVSKVAGAAIKPFEEMGKKVGSMASSLPKYTPIPGTGGLSLKSADKLMNNAQYALDKKHEEDFKGSRYGKIFGGDKVVQSHDEKYIRDAFAEGNQAGAAKASSKIRELIGSGKDVEHSEIPQDIAETLKKRSSPVDKLEYLKWMGYDNDTAQKIIGRLNGGDYRKGDTELINAIKSIGTKTTDPAKQQFAVNEVKAGQGLGKNVEISFNDKLKIEADKSTGDFNDPEKLKQLKEFAKTMTEGEFRSRFTGVSGNFVEMIAGKIKSDFKKDAGTSTPPATPPNP